MKINPASYEKLSTACAAIILLVPTTALAAAWSAASLLDSFGLLLVTLAGLTCAVVVIVLLAARLLHQRNLQRSHVKSLTENETNFRLLVDGVAESPFICLIRKGTCVAGTAAQSV